VRTPSEIEALDAQREAAVVARAVGTRRRLALEEVARRKGLRVLNPLVREEREEAEEET
jgi:ribosomal protein L32E